MILKRLPISIKLALLAGVPVVGALVLSALIAVDVQKRAASAAALGSIEDLAAMSRTITGAMHEIQSERTLMAHGLGHAAKADLGLAKPRPELKKRLKAQHGKTDAAIARLETFVKGRDLSRLPRSLKKNLEAFRLRMKKLAATRTAAGTEKFPIDKALAFYDGANGELIAATAGLAQLSDDGQMLKSISSLVAILEVRERQAREHALLAYVFAAGEFPPGSFKSFVTLLTQAEDYTDVYRKNADDVATELFEARNQGKAVEEAMKMRKVALTTVDDEFKVDADRWTTTKAKHLEQLRGVETALLAKVESAAKKKIEETNSWIRLSMGLAIGVVVVSVALAWLVAHGITTSLHTLSQASARVREEKDYSVRAEKRTHDEVGALTDAFNEMLSGIEARDAELAEHRENLEELVAQRTAALEKRNAEMRVVLDNVEQGLVTVGLDGILSTERSAAFDRMFGAPDGNDHFAEHVARSDERTRDMLKMGWEQLTDDFMPVELSIDQLPKKLVIDGRHVDLSFSPIETGDELSGALLMATDVTEAVQAREKEAEQREGLKIFERVMKDRPGFLEFFTEVKNLMDGIKAGAFTETAEMMRAVHTVKGNCSIYGVESVAKVAHELETFIVETGTIPSDEQMEPLLLAWTDFVGRVEAWLDAGADRIEITQHELEELLAAIRKRTPAEKLAAHVESLRFEPTQTRLERLAEQVRSLALRLGKPVPEVIVDANGLRLPSERWAGFWASFVHILRNSVDHGLEAEEDRVAAGKKPEGVVHLEARKDGNHLVVEVRDDGRGISWDKIREVARKKGMPAETQAQLQEVLFADGTSTAEQVSSTSGRGVGTAAVKESVEEVGGKIDVITELGKGTTFRFRMPLMGPRRRKTAAA